jgi:hypothetical protein
MVLMLVVFSVIFLGLSVLSCGQFCVVVFSRNNVECRSAGRLCANILEGKRVKLCRRANQLPGFAMYSSPSI